MNNNHQKLKILLKIIIILLPIFIGAWLLNKQLAPGGKLEVKYDFAKESPFISKLYPEERVDILKKEENESYKEILDDIIYFDLRLPRSSYQKAKIKIKFKNESQSIFDLAALTSLEKWTFDTYTLENKYIDQSEWNKIQEENLVLLQKEKKFNNIDKFLESITGKTKIAFYNYNKLPKIVEVDNYKKSNKSLEINHALRGNHSFYTYINNEELNFTFNYIDLNREKGEDLFKINVIKEKNGELIAQESIEDDGINISSGILSAEKEFNLKIPKLEKGVYKINLDINEDIIIKKISSKQNLIVFEKNLYLAQSQEYFSEINSEKIPIDFYNTGKNLYVQTENKDGLQNIKINEQEYEINEVGKKFDFGEDILKSEGLNLIHSPKSDLFIESDGYFVFSKDQYFDPQPKNIVQLSENLDINTIDYIIAKYNPNISENNGWKEVTTEFDITKLYVDKNQKIKFMSSSPGLKNCDCQIKISEISVILEKEPVTFEKFWNKIKGFISK